MGKKYCLEFYPENDHRTALGTIESDTPFLAINVGDLLDGRTIPFEKIDDHLFEVTKILHLLIYNKSGDPQHKILIYVKKRQI